jgi:hypothetical protein
MSQDSSPLSKSGKASPTKVDSEVNAKPERRRFSAEYKRRILEDADACTEAVWINRPQQLLETGAEPPL